MNQKYIVQLSEAERYQLKQVISSGTAPARKVRRANILLKSDASQGGSPWTYQMIIDAFGVSNVTISDVRKAYLEGGLEKALNRKKPERAYPHCLDGEGEAYLIALACSEAPDSHERWTLRLLRNRLIQLQVVETISHETVRTTLKKTN